jgi:hypothetical protein
MKPDTNAVSRIAVDNIAFHHDVIPSERYAQRQRVAYGNVSLCAHVQAAYADVLGAGYAGRIAAVKADIDYYSRAIMLPSFVAREVFFAGVLVYHFVPSAT